MAVRISVLPFGAYPHAVMATISAEKMMWGDLRFQTIGATMEPNPTDERIAGRSSVHLSLPRSYPLWGPTRAVHLYEIMQRAVT